MLLLRKAFWRTRLACLEPSPWWSDYWWELAHCKGPWNVVARVPHSAEWKVVESVCTPNRWKSCMALQIRRESPGTAQNQGWDERQITTIFVKSHYYNIHLHGTKWSLFLAGLLSACEVSFGGSCIKTLLLVSVSHDWFAANPKLAEVRPMRLIQRGNMLSCRVSGWWIKPRTMHPVQSKQILSSFMPGICFRKFISSCLNITWLPQNFIYLYIFRWRLKISKAENRLLRSFKTTNERGSDTVRELSLSLHSCAGVRLKLPQLWDLWD